MAMRNRERHYDVKQTKEDDFFTRMERKREDEPVLRDFQPIPPKKQPYIDTRPVKHVPVVEVRLMDMETGETAPFCLTFYGVPFTEFMKVPGGGAMIWAALARRGFGDRYTSSPFHIREVQVTR
jgi:hypothetical protein